MDSGLSNSDVALLSDKNGGMFGGDGAMFWFLALLVLAGGGFGGFGGNHGGPGFVTQADLTNQLNAQTTNQQLQQIALSSANNNYETARVINDQTNALMNQNNTNLINAIQGFNAVNQNTTNLINQLSGKVDQLSYHLDQCCCEIKTQMLQNRLDDANAALVAANGQISNQAQSQYLLGQMGRWVAWTPSGTQATTGN